MKQPMRWRQLKILIAVLAIVNLFLLFGFHYHLPNVPNAASGYRSVYLNKESEAVDSKETADAQKTEKSKPEGYTAPSITLGGDLPAIAQDDLSRIPQLLRDLDLLSADDGAGKDISSDVTCTYTHMQDTTYDVEFQVTNSYGDHAKKNVSMTFNLTKPLIILKQDHVSISVGDSFDPKEFMESATDVNGDDLLDHVVTSGNISTKKAGSFVVEYSVTSPENHSLGTAKLTVTVK